LYQTADHDIKTLVTSGDITLKVKPREPRDLVAG